MHETLDELKKLFSDTLDSGVSKAAIVVRYLDESGIARTDIAVPYSLLIKEPAGYFEEHVYVLDVGPQINQPGVPSLIYFDSRRKQIPLKDIISFRRIELSDVVSE